MRGIVILEVLRQIEEELGRRIPVMNFFDLVVGTRSVVSCKMQPMKKMVSSDCSTGGILAIGLGIKNWSVKQSTELFTNLVNEAFTTKVLGGVMFATTKYSTRHIEDALKKCFKDEPIFGGGPESSSAYARKVAVTAATETGEQAVIFTNYNRAHDDQSNVTVK
jgi:hypothetical protein